MRHLGGLLCWLALAGAIAVGATAATATPSSSWTTWGGNAQHAGSGAAEPAALTRQFVLPLTGEITNQVLASGGYFYVATSTGEVVSFDASGLVRWRVSVGQLASACPQLKGYGVTGTGVIDPATKTLYVADAFGRLHALALGTGAERSGWPVQVFTDDQQELDWGALTLADGSVYVPTAAYCDASNTPGAVYRVQVASKEVSRWLVVPLSSGGGGGPWGWGGLAFDPTTNSLFAGTSGAFPGGSNTGTSFTEFIGHSDQLVQLAPNLAVDDASRPADVPDRRDTDFVGSPLIIDPAGCGPLVLAANKTNTVYAWRPSTIGAGPLWEAQVQPFDPSDPMLTQLAWSPSLSSVYVVTGTQLARISVARDCSAKIAWREPLDTRTENGSPTIAGTTVWFVVNGKTTLVGYDAVSGKRVFSTPLGGLTVTAPTVAGGRLMIGTMTGLVEGFSFSQPQASRLRRRRSLASARQIPPASASLVSKVGSSDEWQSRRTGVYSTENGGKSWHRIYPAPAETVLRLSKTAGVIEVGLAPGPCMCTTRKLWTADDGTTWHETRAIGDDFSGSGTDVYWWQGGTLDTITDFPPKSPSTPLRSQVATKIPDGTIVDTAQLSDGIAVLVSSRVDGEDWDTDPRVLIVRGDDVQTLTLPPVQGEILAEQITADWPMLTVSGTDYGVDPPGAVTWTSNDGGQSWSASP